MNTFKRVPSPNLTDFETVICRQELGSKNEAILMPKSESELASKFGAKTFDFGGNHSRPTANEAYGVGPQSVERDNPLHEFEGAEPAPEIITSSMLPTRTSLLRLFARSQITHPNLQRKKGRSAVDT